jgi:hypothetical protein
VVNRLFDLLMYVEDNHSGFVWDVVRMIIFMGVLAYGLLTVATAIGVVALVGIAIRLLFWFLTGW